MRLAVAACLSLLLGASGAALADAESGRSIYAARGCLACHGVDGVSRAPEFPTLKGRSAAFVRQNLTDFRSGERLGGVMNSMARNLSDDDIRDLADYIGGL